MRVLILMLILAAFLQATLLPYDLVLVILILRSFISSEKTNLYLAFFSGFLVSHLDLTIWGFHTFIYVVLVEVTQAVSTSAISRHILTLVVLVFATLSLNEAANALILKQSLHLFPKVAAETVISIPLFYLIRLWEERFVVKKEIKLHY